MLIDLDNSNPHLIYNKEKLCYECKISRRILNFEIDIPEEGFYTFSMKYNSMNIPNFIFFYKWHINLIIIFVNKEQKEKLKIFL